MKKQRTLTQPETDRAARRRRWPWWPKHGRFSLHGHNEQAAPTHAPCASGRGEQNTRPPTAETNDADRTSISRLSLSLSPAGGPCDLVDVERGRVRAEDGRGLAHRVQLLKYPLLQAHVLKHGFHNLRGRQSRSSSSSSSSSSDSSKCKTIIPNASPSKRKALSSEPRPVQAKQEGRALNASCFWEHAARAIIDLVPKYRSASLLTKSQSFAALMLRAGLSSVLTASAVFLDTFPRRAAERTPRSKYASPLSRFSCESRSGHESRGKGAYIEKRVDHTAFQKQAPVFRGTNPHAW